MEQLDQPKTSADIYALLREKSKQMAVAVTKARELAVGRAKAGHDSSVNFQSKMGEGGTWAASQDSLMSTLTDLNRSMVQSQGYHVVFCLDESASMSGQPWDDLATAFSKFIKMCASQGGGQDLISVVQFGTVARTTLRLASLQEASRCVLEMKPGSTLFKPALTSASTLFLEGSVRAPDLVPMLVFMSDGANTDGGMTSRMSKLCQEAAGLQCHTIFFGTGGSTRLRKMAAEVVGGKYHLSIGGVELQHAFEAIAADLTAL